MNPVFIQLSKNLTTLQEQLMLVWNELVEHNLKPLAEKLLKLINEFFANFKAFLEGLQLEKLSEAAISFLDEVEQFLLDAYNRFSLPQSAVYETATKNTIQAVRNQVIFLDQYRQSIFAYK
jgi:hypothetical protein